MKLKVLDKLCCKCKTVKNAESFSRNKTTKDGLAKWCKMCVNEGNKIYRQKSESKLTRSNWLKKYRNENPGKTNAWTRKRQLAKMSRTPKWLTAEQLNEIEEFYVLAKELSWLSEDPLTVDHIVPLQGEYISGLHVPWNLQILPMTLNSAKANKYAA